MSLERVLGNRNLTNKLWNAGKFLQMQLAACSDSELAELAAAEFSTSQSLAELPLVERWILSALHQVRCPLVGFVPSALLQDGQSYGPAGCTGVCNVGMMHPWIVEIVRVRHFSEHRRHMCSNHNIWSTFARLPALLSITAESCPGTG